MSDKELREKIVKKEYDVADNHECATVRECPCRDLLGIVRGCQSGGQS